MKLSKRMNKLISINLIASVSFASVFSFPINVSAGESFIGYTTTNDLRLRSKPTTATENGVSNILLEIDEGTKVTVLSSDKISGQGCTDGWYHINYQGTEGYVCSKYITTTWADAYDRPWTSPKKAIVGGAKFIAKSYISKGQFTSYLKKFNVNPNSYYPTYNHQYMANLAAPSSEAKTSWNAYVKNNLSNLPLEFSIPIYNAMAEYYPRPQKDLATIEKQMEIADQGFEDYLNGQGFPESYKPALRALHTKHPNWVFKAMPTGISFGEAIAVEKSVSSIQGGPDFYDYSTGQAIQTEAGWYIANDQTVAYYLDPRNFLTETYILQFESLENSSNYTEAVVQGVINNTFMSGLSILDNQSYSSIFVEAGNTANVSSVYLASLAIQESGTSIRNTTSGETFDYEGITYSGLFNFFNIGANSSASNPSKAGLVYASGGACTICSNNGVYVPKENLATYINAAGLKLTGNYVNGFAIGETVASIQGKLQNASIGVNSSNGLMGTGSTISYNGETYTVVLYGDLTGDGKINSADLLKMRQHLQGTSPLNGAFFKAGSLVNGSTINSADLLRLRQFLLGTQNISQV